MRRLRERELIREWFFLRYWLEGKHLRLRVKPSSLSALPEVRSEVEAAVGAFLAERPSVYDPRLDLPDEDYRERFLLEYSEDQWHERYGTATSMPRRENNTFEFMEYTPEMDRYGGPAGLRISESHFCASSDIVLEIAETQNLHVRTEMLGVLAQLMAIMGLVFFPRPERTAEFFHSHLDKWDDIFGGRHDDYEDGYQRMAPSVRARVRMLYEAVRDDEPERLSGYLRRWLEHCVTLRADVDAALERGELDWGTNEPPRVYTSMLRSYLHMTANRLGATVDKELYLSYVLREAIRAELMNQNGDT